MADSKLTIVTRLPNEVFRARLDSYVKLRKIKTPGYSMNQMVLDALRMLADSPAQSETLAPGPEPTRVSTLENPNRIERPFWYRWEIESKQLEGEARDESFKEALDQRLAAGLALHENFWKWAPNVRMNWLREHDNGQHAGGIVILGPAEPNITKPTQGRKLIAAEIAASIPGVRVGLSGPKEAEDW